MTKVYKVEKNQRKKTRQKESYGNIRNPKKSTKIKKGSPI